VQGAGEFDLSKRLAKPASVVKSAAPSYRVWYGSLLESAEQKGLETAIAQVETWQQEFAALPLSQFLLIAPCSASRFRITRY